MESEKPTPMEIESNEHHLLKLPRVLCRHVFVFLSAIEVVQMEATCFQLFQMSQCWLGDAQSKRLRPLEIHKVRSDPQFPPLLHHVYQSHLLLWSVACRTIFKNQSSHKSNNYRDIPRKVIYELFTSPTFRNKQMTQRPIDEQAFQNTVSKSTDFFINFMQSLVNKNVEDCFNMSSDRKKLLFIEATTKDTGFQSVDILSLMELSFHAITLVMPSRADFALKFMHYILWTVWGPYGTPKTKHDLALHPTQLPPTQPLLSPQQQIVMNDAVCNALPNSYHLLHPENIATSSSHTFQSMFNLNSVQSVRWYLDPTFRQYLDIVADTNKRLIVFDVFRRKHIVQGFSLQQRLVFYVDRIEIEYWVTNLSNGERYFVYTSKYDVMVPREQEPAELMCWKYIPIHTIHCQFSCHLTPCETFQRRIFNDLCDAKIMTKQRNEINLLLKDVFWQAFGLQAPSVVSTRVHPRYSVVNNCIWDVFYSVINV